MKPIKKVIIKDEKYEDGYSELFVKISEPEKFKETIMLRARAKITSYFMHPGFRPALPDPQLQNSRNSSLFLWFCSLGSNKADLNHCA